MAKIIILALNLYIGTAGTHFKARGTRVRGTTFPMSVNINIIGSQLVIGSQPEVQG